MFGESQGFLLDKTCAQSSARVGETMFQRLSVMVCARCLPTPSFSCSVGQYSNFKTALNCGKGVGKVPRVLTDKALHSPDKFRII